LKTPAATGAAGAVGRATFTLAQRQQIKKLALSRPQDHDLPFSTWSLAKLADFLVAEGVVDDISHEGLRTLLDDEAVSFQRLKTWKQSCDPDYQAKQNRLLHLYGLMDGTCDVAPGDPEVVLCLDEFGPLNLQPPSRPPVGPPQRGRTPPAPPAASHLQAPARGAPPVRPLRPVTGQALRSRQSAAASCSDSCATCAPCIHARSAWRSCWTTPART
jgi:hypothetical protein